MNVIYPSFLEEIIKKIGDNHFSIILDESTDVGCDKLMAYCACYYNQKEKKVIKDFLGVQLVGQATAKIQYQNLLSFF